MKIPYNESVEPLRKKFPKLTLKMLMAHGLTQGSRIRVLRLTVKEPWFSLMVCGDKPMEFRKPGKWIESRIYEKTKGDRKYDFIEFTNGYNADSPAALFAYEGFGTGYGGVFTFETSPGLELSVNNKDYALFLGKLVVTSNIKKNAKEKNKRIPAI